MIYKEITHTSIFKEYSTIGELSPVDKAIAEKAMEISRNAYAPYSGFKVGAAILLENGEVILGTNQENASFPVGVCAERVALFYANTHFPNEKMIKIAIAAFSDNEYSKKPVTPCGICRQALLEFENKNNFPIEIIMIGEDKVIVANSARDLMPLTFDFEKKHE